MINSILLVQNWKLREIKKKKNLLSATMENSMEVPQKTKSRVTIWSNNPTSGHISGKDKNSNSKRYMHPNDHRSTIYNSQDMGVT